MRNYLDMDCLSLRGSEATEVPIHRDHAPFPDFQSGLAMTVFQDRRERPFLTWSSSE